MTNINRRVETPPSPAPYAVEEVAAAPAPSVAAPAPAPSPAKAKATPMPNVQSATASTVPGADDMQQKIANLQRQLADLAKNRA